MEIALDEEAPEDAQTELPCSFPDALHYMEMSVEEAEKEFFSLFDSHIHPEFAARTSVVDLMKTKGLRVFVPSNWEGVKGISPIKLKFEENIPVSMKPRARPVPPKLYAYAKKA